MIADTNVLLRVVIRDDEAQATAAERMLSSAEIVAVTLPALCEFAWVLRQRYKLSCSDVAQAVRALVDSAKVATDQRAVAAGLSMLDAGGDFADGVIAFEGRGLGGGTFASFDRAAVNLLDAQGIPSQLVGA